jgi:hypothetical protein
MTRIAQFVILSEAKDLVDASRSFALLRNTGNIVVPL